MADFAPVVSPRHVLVIASTDADAALAASALEASSTTHFAAAAIVAPSSAVRSWRRHAAAARHATAARHAPFIAIGPTALAAAACLRRILRPRHRSHL